MANPRVNLSPYGLEEIKEYLNPSRINKGIAIGVHDAVLQIHDALRSAVARKYTFRDSLDTALVGRSISNVEIGKNFIRNGLQYVDKQKDLSKFPYTLGAIIRNGTIHNVEVVRGRSKRLRGRSGQGGFVPRKKGAPPTRFGFKGETQMFERIGRSRYPLRLLLAPSLSDAATRMYDTDKQVQQVLQHVEETILDKFI